jgi:hypothetical protein
LFFLHEEGKRICRQKEGRRGKIISRKSRRGVRFAFHGRTHQAVEKSKKKGGENAENEPRDGQARMRAGSGQRI